MNEIQPKICQLIGITPEEYAVAIWEMGNDYMTQYSAGCQEYADFETTKPSFWKWYKEQFNTIDLAFYKRNFYSGSSEKVKKALKKAWENEHDYYTIVSRIKPPTGVLNVDEFIKQERMSYAI